MAKAFAAILGAVGLTLLWVALLFADGISGSSSGYIASVVRGAVDMLSDPKIQWMVFLCFGLYLMVFFFLRYWMDRGFLRAMNGNIWLGFVILIGTVIYATDYASSVQALTLLGGAVLGQGAGLWTYFERKRQKLEARISLAVFVVFLLVILLAIASVWDADSGRALAYHGQARRTGPWESPNVYGLLMGMGGTLALGFLVHSLSSAERGVRSAELRTGDAGGPRQGWCGVGWRMETGGWWKIPLLIWCLLAAILMGWGLLHSYSRGAWCGTLCGLGFLAWCEVQGRSNAELGDKFKVQGLKFKVGEGGNIEPRTSNIEHRMAEAGPSSQIEIGAEAHPLPGHLPRGEGGTLKPPGWIRRNGLSVGIMVCALAAILFWHFRQTEWHPAHRAFSVGNQNDFSWRNRIAAWEGALQIMAEHPWFGAGWSQPEPMYEQYYLPPRLGGSGGSAIQLNDYFMLGTTLGVPALFCFGMYVWLSLMRSAECGVRSADWLKAVCRAGAIVLLVGFWFDGGLFKLATAAPFWILLELGRDGGYKEAQNRKNEHG